MKKRGVYNKIVLFIIIFVLSAGYVFAEEVVPTGPDSIDILTSGRHINHSNPVTVQAKAGNVTALRINSTRVTQAWQGYYGNITGVITLDDADNFTMYNWEIPSPQGEIYASNGSEVIWSNVYCMNLSYNANDAAYAINSTQIERNFGINNTEYGDDIEDYDGLNETFYDFYTDPVGFRVGSIEINNLDGCSLAHPFTDEQPNTGWDELLLTDNRSLIFTGLLREDGDNFQPGDQTSDFQLMVLENGHYGEEAATTNYYFYVELS